MTYLKIKKRTRLATNGEIFHAKNKITENYQHNASVVLQYYNELNILKINTDETTGMKRVLQTLNSTQIMTELSKSQNQTDIGVQSI